MSKIYDWENDSFLTTSTNPIPKKERIYPEIREKQDNTTEERVEYIKYYEDEVKTDEKGRRYFLRGSTFNYLDDLNQIYHICVNDKGETEEFIIVNKGLRLTFTDETHIIAKDQYNNCYQYNAETQMYEYAENITLFPGLRK